MSLQSSALRFAFTLVAVAASACTLQKTAAPDLAGPSELGLSLAIAADPSTLTQDGISRSRITITARGPNGEPRSNIVLRAEITVNGVAFDFGRLSTRNPITSTDGIATVTYTAPDTVGDSVDNFTIVTIFFTPAEGDHRSSQARSIDLRLVPPGVILPPNQAGEAVFSFSPTTPNVFTRIFFDASESSDPDGIVSYAWNFGDGETDSGVTTDHEYELPGTYNVVLTITDRRGAVTRSEPVSITVQGGEPPTASFTMSPVSASTGERVFFNASASTAGVGRQIEKYEWNLGTSTGEAEGVIVSKVYDVEGIFTITLTVTDDVGQTGTSSQQLTVGAGGPGGVSASFTFSPTDPVPGATVFFDASSSSSPRDITEYKWSFGDGDSGSGRTVSHTFDDPGTYVVTLTIEDSSGRTAQASEEVPVQEPGDDDDDEAEEEPAPVAAAPK
jgi:PKD repeat protein